MSSLSSSGCGNVVLVVTKLAHPPCLEKAKAKAKRRTKGKEAMKKKKPTASMLILQAIHVLGLTEAAPGGGGVADESVKKLIPHTVLSPSSWATTIQRMRNKGDLAPRQPEPNDKLLRITEAGKRKLGLEFVGIQTNDMVLKKYLLKLTTLESLKQVIEILSDGAAHSADEIMHR